MKIYKLSTIFKTSQTYFLSVFIAMLFCMSTIPFSGETFASTKSSAIAIGAIALFASMLVVLVVMVYWGLYSLRYIVLDEEQIIFRCALPPVRKRAYRYTEIVKCVIAADYSQMSPLNIKVYTKDGKMCREPIAMVPKGDLREIADQLMAHKVTVESAIKL